MKLVSRFCLRWWNRRSAISCFLVLMRQDWPQQVRGISQQRLGARRSQSHRKTDSLPVNLLPPHSVAYSAPCSEKSPEKNWFVALHQDLSIPVIERLEAPTFWLVRKEGVIYTQPPVQVLKRLSLCACTSMSVAPTMARFGVVPESHRLGRLSDSDIAAEHNRLTAIDCYVPRAGVQFCNASTSLARLVKGSFAYFQARSTFPIWSTDVTFGLR